MKVLHKGLPPEEETLVGICPRCHSIFEAEQSEVWIGNAPENEYVSYCPICPKEVTVKMNMSSSNEAFNLRIVALRPRII